MSGFNSLRQRLADRTAAVCVVGQGYVGLSVAGAAAEAGFTTVGIDTDDERVEALGAGENPVAGIDDATVRRAVDTGRLRFSSDFSEIDAADVVVICVPTPLVDHRPDVSAIEAASRSIASHLSPSTLVILESTTYPGTTEQLVAPILESGGRRRAGVDFALAYSPERINPGSTEFAFAAVPRVVGGIDEASAELAERFYGNLVEKVHVVSSCRAAELAKLLENTYRMVNIALVNELAQLCADQGIDTWEVIEAAATKPFGFVAFEPGPGVGGHCIPLDPAYLTWQSRRDTGRPFRLVELAKDINDQMPAYVAARVTDLLNDRGLPVRGARVLALGVTYKPDVGDVRESAAILVLAHLVAKGAVISFHDPFVERITSHDLDLARIDLSTAAIADADAVLLLTPHSAYDLATLLPDARVVFDARGATRPLRGGNIVTL